MASMHILQVTKNKQNEEFWSQVQDMDVTNYTQVILLQLWKILSKDFSLENIHHSERPLFLQVFFPGRLNMQGFWMRNEC